MITETATSQSQKKWSQKLGTFATPTVSRSIFELSVTMIGLGVSWALMLWTVTFSYPLTLLLSLLAGGFVVRTFIIQHDCGHGSFFKKKAANEWVGRVMGILTLVPYDCWRKAHARHHAGSGNLDRRGVGDVDTMTVKEYRGLSKSKRFLYWLYRHPIVLLGLGPIWYFFIKMRLPFGQPKPVGRVVGSVMWTNIVLGIIVTGLIWWLGWKTFLMVHLPIYMVSNLVGVWMFYIQHQFEETHWDHQDEWEHEEAALNGSSYYQLPRPLEWLTGNIGIHHVHHLNSRIPFYRLPDCIEHYSTLSGTNRVTSKEALKATILTLWDEEDRRLITFGEERKLRRQNRPVEEFKKAA